MASPYDNLPAEAFWHHGVAQRPALEPVGLYEPRFRLTRKTRIMTAGSCFAQHIGAHLRADGWAVQDAEPMQAAIPADVAAQFGFGQFSARFGNIYTMRQLLQVTEQALGLRDPTAIVWEKDGRFYDAQRPGVEPQGLASKEDVIAHRVDHLRAVENLLRNTDVLVFTFGLTEAWIDTQDGTVYPTAPGVIAGEWDPDRVAFHNFTVKEMNADFQTFRAIMRDLRPKLRILLTVSPVPLTATASGMHVELATAYSKGALRALCGQLRARHSFVDYFPSYEIITSQSARGTYFEPNMRSVSAKGVSAAMSVFLAHHSNNRPTAQDISVGRVNLPGRLKAGQEPKDAQCEDALLDAFKK